MSHRKVWGESGRPSVTHFPGLATNEPYVMAPRLGSPAPKSTQILEGRSGETRGRSWAAFIFKLHLSSVLMLDGVLLNVQHIPPRGIINLIPRIYRCLVPGQLHKRTLIPLTSYTTINDIQLND